jgi:hypothetical protein
MSIPEPLQLGRSGLCRIWVDGASADVIALVPRPAFLLSVLVEILWVAEPRRYYGLVAAAVAKDGEKLEVQTAPIDRSALADWWMGASIRHRLIDASSDSAAVHSLTGMQEVLSAAEFRGSVYMAVATSVEGGAPFFLRILGGIAGTLIADGALADNRMDIVAKEFERGLRRQFHSDA